MFIEFEERVLINLGKRFSMFYIKSMKYTKNSFLIMYFFSQHTILANSCEDDRLKTLKFEKCNILYRVGIFSSLKIFDEPVEKLFFKVDRNEINIFLGRDGKFCTEN